MSFVALHSFWKTESERTIDSFSRIYENRALLRSVVGELFATHLPKEHLAGKQILIKPNLVKQNRIPGDALCLRTNENLILAVLEVVLEQKPISVVIADTPIQGCDWEGVTSTLAPSVSMLSSQFGIPVSLVDLRRVRFDQRTNVFQGHCRPLERNVLFDLGRDSLLEPLCDDRHSPFRLLQYSAKRLAQSHHSGVHKYCLAREVFECDTIISLPKLKTHEKTCITNALKNLVGVNGDKDYLPHHRVGGTGMGGDCYKGGNILRRFAEFIFDIANEHIGTWLYRPTYILGRMIWKLSFPGAEHTFTAGWHGNDTVWRMVHDLNRIVLYGTVDGMIRPERQRTIYTLSDAIIIGQGNGPLRPEPLPMGFLMFSDNSPLLDHIAARLMSFRPECIPMLKYSSCCMEEPFDLICNKKSIKLEELKKLAVSVKLPLGWVNYTKHG